MQQCQKSQYSTKGSTMCEIPEDVLNHIIMGYVDDLNFLDHKKKVLSKVSKEAQHEYINRVVYVYKDNLDGVGWAEDYVNVGLDEEQHGPSGDRGNYICHNVQCAIKDYVAEVEYWNTFVEINSHIYDYLPPYVRKYFTPIIPKWTCI